MKIEIEAKEALEAIKELRKEAEQLVQSLEKAIVLAEKLKDCSAVKQTNCQESC